MTTPGLVTLLASQCIQQNCGKSRSDVQLGVE